MACECNTPGCDGDPVSLYAIYSKHGLLMDRFDDLDIAGVALRAWKDAAFIACGTNVLERKEDVAIIQAGGDLVQV